MISIHAPLAGSDGWTADSIYSNNYFNPRSPRGERPSRSLISSLTFDFNPRSPRGERLLYDIFCVALLVFQSTLPSRGATSGIKDTLDCMPISIHAPLAGSDCV